MSNEILSETYVQFTLQLKTRGLYDREPVYGVGPERARIMLIGEAPGETEEKQGQPFVGKAGKNLDQFLDIVGLNRDEIFITNAVKFRPVKPGKRPGTFVNRTPDKAELQVCSELLRQELRLVQPEYVVTLGNTALRAVVGDKSMTIGNVHGCLTHIAGSCCEFMLFPLYHPASVIYRRELLTTYMEDIAKLALIVNKN